MTVKEIQGFENAYSNITGRNAKQEKSVIDGSYLECKIEAEKKKAPYSYLADETGMIQYKGAVFVCDNEKQTISLGDVTADPKQVLTIPLEDGGCLKVNRDSIGALGHAITMFSPGDIKRILNAIAQDEHCTRKQYEIDEIEDYK